MHITDDPEERIALIMEGNKCSEADAIKIMQNKKDFSQDVQRLRELATLLRMKSKRGIDRKTLAGGNNE
jgi:hypothetical protein